MLRIIQSTSASAAKRYFSTSDYYSEGQELSGTWRGKGAERLGLRGTIQQADWDALCDNRRPDNGQPLTARRKSERRIGWDCNFHAPKSLSLLYGTTRDERLLEAFQSSVRETMGQMEIDAKARVRAEGMNTDRLTGNLIWGEYTHFTSRPVDGVPDCHLHSHCFVMNATHDPMESRWKALQLGDIKRDARYYEAVFHSKLARNVELLGLATERTRTGWEIAGLYRSTLDKFSRRTQQIEAMAKELGIHDPEAKAELGAATREKKSKELSMPELAETWKKRLDSRERARLDRLVSQIGSAPIPEDANASREAVKDAMSHCFERSSVVPERFLLGQALRRSLGKGSQASIEAMVRSQPLIHGEREGRRFVTTQEVLAEERAMLEFARQGRGACRPINANRTAFNRDWLNTEQRNAVRHVLSSRDRVVLIRGAAGTGKTTMMQEAKEAIEEAGYRVHTFAPSASASRGVLRDEGFDAADTVARLLADSKLQGATRGGIIWVDEAGLLGTRTMRELFECAETHDARIVLSGDRRQHGSVERGAALRLLETDAGLIPAELKEIQRQKDQYKAAVAAISEGKTSEGFQRLDDLGWIHEVEHGDRERAIADAYLDAVNARRSALVISPTHREGDRITRTIRDTLKSEGLIKSDARSLASLSPVSLTVAERRDPVSYEPGDVLVFHQNAKGHVKGARLTVGEDMIPFDQAQRFTVYRPDQIEIATGDRIRITKNGEDAKGSRLNNGDLYAVKGFTPKGDLIAVRPDRKGDEKLIPADYGHFTYGLVVTSHASQGKTVDRVIIGQSAESLAASSKEQFYVSVSRGRQQVQIFTDDKEALLNAVMREDDRLSGTELARMTHRHRISLNLDHPMPIPPVRDLGQELYHD